MQPLLTNHSYGRRLGELRQACFRLRKNRGKILKGKGIIMDNVIVEKIANRQMLEVIVPGPGNANRLLIYTGTAVFEWFSISAKLSPGTVKIVLGPNNISNPKKGDNFAGNPFLYVGGVTSASLSSNSPEIAEAFYSPVVKDSSNNITGKTPDVAS